MLERIINLLQGGIQPLPFTTTGTPAAVMAVFDIILVALLIYATIRFLRHTRATYVLWSLCAIILLILVARLLNLNALNAVLTLFAAALLIALPILFHPEIRRGLERIGRTLPFIGAASASFEAPVIAAISNAIETLRARRWGALIVLERRTYLTEYIDSGSLIRAEVSAPLLEAVFAPESPLHDGAVIIRGSVLMAAGCTLPLADTAGRASPAGTRHRAGQGISEVSDAVAIIVSEETGRISLAADGRLLSVSHPPDLRSLLVKLLTPRADRRSA